jgi:hypothetical protein
MLNLTPSEFFQVVFGLVSSLISLLLLGNLFFLKKLIHKVDQIDSLTATIAVLAKRLDDLCGRIELLNDLRIEVATLKARFYAAIKRHSLLADDEREEETLS